MPVFTPNQARSMDPYGVTRTSREQNIKSRLWSGGNNVILFPTSSFRLIGPTVRNITVTPGLGIFDDVLVHVTEEFNIDTGPDSEYDWMDEDSEFDYPTEIGGAPGYEELPYIIIFLRYKYSIGSPAPVLRLYMTESFVHLIENPDDIYLGFMKIELSPTLGIYVPTQLSPSGYSVPYGGQIHVINRPTIVGLNFN